MSLEEWRQKAAEGAPPEDVILRKEFVPVQVKASDDATRRITFTITTGAVDRQGDTVAVDGWDISNYLKNPVVLWAHRYDQLPVAKAISLVKSAGALKATAEFPPAGLYPMADTVYEFLKGGFLRATSVGFRPIKSCHNEDRPGYAMDFIEQELLEFSVVPVPANPEALMDMAKGLACAAAAGLDLAPIEKAIALARAATDTEQPTSVVRQPIEVRIDGKAVADAIVEKSGRTFNAANAKRIRTAYDHCSGAIEHLKELVDQVTPDDEPEGDEEVVETEAAPKAAEPVESATPIPAPVAPESTKDVLTAADLVGAFEAAMSKALSAGTPGQGANA